MKKGYTETMPLGSHDPQGMPIWGPAEVKKDAKTRRKNKQEHVSQREQARADAFKRNSEREVPWAKTLRLAGNHTASFDHINFEGVYRGFRQRLIDDPAFQHEVLETVLDRIMAELYVPMSHRPRAGLKLKICRRKKDDG